VIGDLADGDVDANMDYTLLGDVRENDTAGFKARGN